MAETDITGQRFGMLTVIERVSKRSQWRCICDCGNECIRQGNRIRRVNSCGCGKNAATARRNFRHGLAQRSAIAPEYRAWLSIIARCENKNRKDYPYYGGRGIRLCDLWRNDFVAFLSHVGRRPSSRHTIDRIDNGKGYEPGNVRWATRKTQSRNRRGRKLIEFQGEMLPASVVAERAGANYDLFLRRLSNGWTVEEALKPSLGLFGGRGGARFEHKRQRARQQQSDHSQ